MSLRNIGPPQSTLSVDTPGTRITSRPCNMKTLTLCSYVAGLSQVDLSTPIHGFY